MNTSAPASESSPLRSGAAGQRAARLCAVQALYQIALSGAPMDAVLEEFLRHRIREPSDEGETIRPRVTLFTELVRGTHRRRDEIDGMIAATLTEAWSLERLETVLRCIVEAGVYELLCRSQTPARVVINEYVDLAHAFYAGSEPGMVNGILDRLARRLRPAEFGIAAGE